MAYGALPGGGAPFFFNRAGGYPQETNTMALVDIKLGKDRRKFTEFVVVGDEDKGCKLGDIRWVQWDRNTSSPLLAVTYKDADRDHALEIRVHPDFSRRGWRLLRDMSGDKGEQNAHRWADFVAFADAQALHPDAMHGKTFPEEWLPVELQEMRKRGKVDKADRFDIELPSGVKLSDLTSEDPKGVSKRSRSA